MAHRVLIVTTSTGEIGPDGPAPQETGFDWQSLAVPYWRLHEAGVEIGFASIAGGKPPGDPASAGDPRLGAVEMFLGSATAVTALSASAPAEALDPEDWTAALLTDGPGGLWDLPQSDALSGFLTALWGRGGVIAAIGAGTAGLLKVRDRADRALASGRRIAAPPDTRFAELDAAPPVLPASALAAQGAQILGAPEGETAGVTEDGRLVTTHDGSGSADLALQLLDALDVFGPGLAPVAEAEDPADTAAPD